MKTFKRCLPLFILLVLMAIVYFTGLTRYLSYDYLKSVHDDLTRWVSQHAVISVVLFILVYTASTALSLPGGFLLSLVGGFLFPIPWSTLYVVVGATMGATFLFYAAKTALGDSLQKKAGPFLKKMEKGFQENAVSYLLFLRFVPLFPFWLVNLAPAFFHVRATTYIWTTFVGIIPGAFVFTLAGSGLSALFESPQGLSIDAIFNLKIKLALLALAVTALIPIVIKRMRRNARHPR